jgi:5-methyltetrahydrofolate--homocysteine methyltransferase
LLSNVMKKEFIILDGAMGTMLQKRSKNAGLSMETICFSDEHAVEEVHRMYIESGSDMIYTNTLCANATKLEGTGISPAELISKAVEIARRAAKGTDVLVALDVGAIGDLMEPAGDLTFERAYSMFAEQVIAGEKAGADLIVFETMSDLYEVKAGVLAAKENTSLPVFVTMTFGESKRTFTGCDVRSMACTLQGLGVDAVGINCSLGPKEIYPIAADLSHYTSLPIIIKPNAGLPDPITGEFNVDPDQFADEMIKYAQLGVRFVGGCCGAGPEYIKLLKQRFEKVERPVSQYFPGTRFCTPTNVVELDRVRVVGENINPTGKKPLQDALKSGDMSYVEQLAVAQAEAGADLLDVNVGVPGIDGQTTMANAIKAIQGVTTLPLVIDSTDPKVLESGLRAYNGKPLVNSVTGEAKSIEYVLPLVKKYGAAVIGLTLDENGIPTLAEDRVRIAEKILNACNSYGIAKEDLIIDCLVLTASAQQSSAMETLRAAKMVKEKLGLKTCLGISNISYGLPQREIVNRTYLALALNHGIDMVIINPTCTSMMDTIYAYRLLTGTDQDLMSFLDYMSANYNTGSSLEVKGDKTFRFDEHSNLDNSRSSITSDLCDILQRAVLRGLKEDATQITSELLNSMGATEIIDGCLVPALDNVGKLYETGDIFLPQLLKSADAAGAAFDIIRDSLKGQGTPSASKGKILLATVQGDIHDIGKNIVKAMLENYGYTVIDLGKDVSPDTIVDTAISEDIRLIGLSALMTTTAEFIGKTVERLRESGHECKVMAGGAVLTEEYAKKLGADFYAKDAAESLRIAKDFFGK